MNPDRGFVESLETVSRGEPFFWDRYRDSTADRYLCRHELAFVTAVLGREPLRSVLDVGCGSGRITLALEELGLNVCGLDISPAALAALRRASDHVPLVSANAHALPFRDNGFGCVVAIQLINQVEYRQFLRESCRVLRDDGLLLFSMVNRRSYKRVLRRALHLRGTVSPSENVSCQEALQIAAAHGFRIERVRGYNWVPFDRCSDSAFVGFAARLERWLRLEYCPRFSPWILVAARKRAALSEHSAQHSAIARTSSA